MSTVQHATPTTEDGRHPATADGAWEYTRPQTDDTAPPTASDAAWWAGQNRGGCVEGGWSPESTEALTMTAAEYRAALAERYLPTR